MRAQLRKPGACGVLSLEVKYDPAFRLKCTATLIIDDIQHSRKSCHDEYEFKTVPFTIPCCKLHFYHPKLLHIKLQFSKRNKQTPLLPLPEINSIYHAESAGSRDQPRPGSFLKKREEPGNEVVYLIALRLGRCSVVSTRFVTPPSFYSFRILRILENCDYTIK